MAEIRRLSVDGIARLPAWMHVSIAGDFLFVAGTLGCDGVDFAMVAGGVGAETTQALRNIERILGAAGASLTDIVKVTVYLTDIGEFGQMEEAYIEVMGEGGPARTTVEVSRLGLAARVEIDCIAYKPGARS